MRDDRQITVLVVLFILLRASALSLFVTWCLRLYEGMQAGASPWLPMTFMTVCAFVGLIAGHMCPDCLR